MTGVQTCALPIFGPIIEVNNVACTKLEYSREEFLTMNLSDIVDKEIRANIPKDIEAVIKSGHLFETVHVSKSGVKIHVEINLHDFSLNPNRVILAIVCDITERKR